MIDLQKICSLVIGHSLEGLILGKQLSKNEQMCSQWLTNSIFSSGIDNENIEVEVLVELSYLALSEYPETALAAIEKLPFDLQKLCRLAINLPNQYDEACAVSQESCDKNIFYDKLVEIAEMESWELEDEKRILDIITRCLITTLLKHTGMLEKSPSDPAVKEVYQLVLSWRNRLINKVGNINIKEGDEYQYDGKDQDTSNNTLSEASIIDYSVEEFNIKVCGQKILERCLFILIFVKGMIFSLLYFKNSVLGIVTLFQLHIINFLLFSLF